MTSVFGSFLRPQISRHDHQSEHADVFDGPVADSEMAWTDEPAEEQDEPTTSVHNISKDAPKRRKPRNHKLDTLNQYKAWKEIVPSLVEPLLSYVGSTTRPNTICSGHPTVFPLRWLKDSPNTLFILGS
jgi:hypothetical protein